MKFGFVLPRGDAQRLLSLLTRRSSLVGMDSLCGASLGRGCLISLAAAA
jgi:hypothetical protein